MFILYGILYNRPIRRMIFFRPGICWISFVGNKMDIDLQNWNTFEDGKGKVSSDGSCILNNG